MTEHADQGPTVGQLVAVAHDKSTGYLRLATADDKSTAEMTWLGGDAFAHTDVAEQLGELDALVPYPGNPRRGDQDAITASVRSVGLYRAPIVQRSTAHVLIGNHLRNTLEALGAKLTPATWVDVSDSIARQMVVRDNRTSDRGGYDAPELLALLAAIADDKVPATLLGYDDADTAVLRRLAEAEDVFTVGTDHMLDEFRGISGQTEGTDYAPTFAYKLTVYVRDDAALVSLSKKLGLDFTPKGDLDWPNGWTHNQRPATT